MQRFIKHTFYTKLAIFLAYALLFTLPMYTTQAMHVPNRNITLRPTTVQLLNEYKNYPNWVNPDNGKPFLFCLYDQSNATLLNFFKYIIQGLSIPTFSFSKQLTMSLDAVALSINTPYNGQNLFIRSVKENKFEIFQSISAMHGAILINNALLYFSYLNLDYKDQNHKTIGDYINDNPFSGRNSASYNQASLQWYNSATAPDFNDKVKNSVKALLTKLRLTENDKRYRCMMKEAQDIIDSKGMLQERNKNVEEDGGWWDTLKYGVYIGIPSLIAIAMAFFIYTKKHRILKQKTNYSITKEMIK